MPKKMSAFGLRNFSGSCWVNACLQAIFRIPEIQQRYMSDSFEKINEIDESMQKIYKSNGQEGLKDLFESVRTKTMPAGKDTGDSHELLQYLCDRLPYLDQLCRFKIANSLECINCKDRQLKEDSVIEYSLTSDGKHIPISNCIRESVIPNTVLDWKCDKCSKLGGVQQQLIGTFPKVMVFHMVSVNASIDYSSILILNSKKYALLGVVCYSGSHWWTRGRNMPPGSTWYTFDDIVVTEHGSKQFPLSNMMRMLIYYRLED